jgi:L-aminopeptidase/D-esterase-like protein
VATRRAAPDLGVLVGHWADPAAATGCTVVLCPGGAVGAVAVRGGGPCSRETEVLGVTRGVEPRQVHGALLTGGSVFGLAACDGVVRWLSERGIGLHTGDACIPIVPALGLYDLGVGDAARRPDADAGYAACVAASAAPPAEGRVGVGTGATVGKAAGMARCSPGGFGVARRALPGGGGIGALIAVNAFGEVVDPASGRIVAGVRAARGRGFVPIDRFLGATGTAPFANTTIGVLVTDLALDREEATELAGQAHAGLARTIRPIHTRVDGDALIVLATGRRRAGAGLIDRIGLQHLAAEAVAAAVLRAVGV